MSPRTFGDLISNSLKLNVKLVANHDQFLNEQFKLMYAYKRPTINTARQLCLYIKKDRVKIECITIFIKIVENTFGNFDKVGAAEGELDVTASPVQPLIHVSCIMFSYVMGFIMRCIVLSAYFMLSCGAIPSTFPFCSCMRRFASLHFMSLSHTGYIFLLESFCLLFMRIFLCRRDFSCIPMYSDVFS